MPTWLAPILASLLDAFPRIAALFARFPVFVPAADIAAVHEAVFNSISIELVPI
jgi:hypothetical protein